MTQKLNFEVNAIELIDDKSSNQLALAEIWVCHDGDNLNHKPISLETLKTAAPTLYNKFVVAEFKYGDFTTHSPNEQIIGFFPKENNLRYEEKDGHTFLVADAIISKVYADWAMNVFSVENERPASMEIEVFDTTIDSMGREEIMDFSFMGVTILSKKTQEACVGSKVSITKFSTEEAEKFYHQFSKYGEVDFTIPDNAKDNAKKGLELYKEHNRGGTSVSLATARYIVKNSKANPDKVRHIAKHFPKHKEEEFEDKTSNGWISCLLYGGREGWDWSKTLTSQMDEIDEKKMSYFSDEIKSEEEKTNTDAEVYLSESGKKEEKNNNMDKDIEKKEEEENKEDMAVEKPEEEKKEDAKEEKEETPEEEKKEEEKEQDMSSETVFDVSTLMAMLETEKQNYAKAVAEKEEIAKKFAEKEQMCNTFAEQVEELKKFKADIEEKQKSFEVDKTLKEVESYVPVAKMSELREKSEKCSLQEINIWQNEVRAVAFEYSSKDKKEEGFKRMGLSWLDDKKDKKSGSVWDRL